MTKQTAGGRATVGSVGLGKHRKFAAGPEIVDKNRDYRLLASLQREIRQGVLAFTKRLSVACCSSSPVPAVTRGKEGPVETGMPGVVRIERTLISRRDGTIDRGPARYFGLQHCGATLVCPVCGRKRYAEASADVELVGRELVRQGFTAAIMTLTARHDRSTRLRDFIKSFQRAERWMRMHRAFKQWAAKTGLQYSIRAVEVTDDAPDRPFCKKTGWHFHIHYLLFFKKDNNFYCESERQKAASALKHLWLQALEQSGLSGCFDSALDIRFSTPKGSKDAATASNSADIEILSRYVAKAFAFEIGSPRTKSGRGGRISVWELQRIALESHDATLLRRYGEYMVAIKGVNWLRMTPALKTLLEQLKQNEEQKDAEQVEVLAEFEKEDFSIVAKYGKQAELLDIADKTDDTNAIIEYVKQLIAFDDAEKKRRIYVKYLDYVAKTAA